MAERNLFMQKIIYHELLEAMVSRCFPWCQEKGEVLNLEQKTITSVEVADMVGKEHKELLRDMQSNLPRARLRWAIFLRKVHIKIITIRADLAIWLQRKAVNLLLTSSLV